MVDKAAAKAKRDTLTRAKAEALIAKVTNPDDLADERFTKHANKPMRQKASLKLARLA